jgi:hypothetical protein
MLNVESWLSSLLMLAFATGARLGRKQRRETRQ